MLFNCINIFSSNFNFIDYRIPLNYSICSKKPNPSPKQKLIRFESCLNQLWHHSRQTKLLELSHLLLSFEQSADGNVVVPEDCNIV